MLSKDGGGGRANVGALDDATAEDDAAVGADAATAATDLSRRGEGGDALEIEWGAPEAPPAAADDDNPNPRASLAAEDGGVAGSLDCSAAGRCGSICDRFK